MSGALMTVKGVTGRPFNVRIVRKGECYGLDDALTWEKDDLCIEFHDATKAGASRLGSRGNLVASYYGSTLKGHEPSRGLMLDLSDPETEIPPGELVLVSAWLAKLGY